MANPVGYQQIKVPKLSWALYTPTFKGIATTMKLGDITVCNPNGLEYNDNKEEPNTGRCRGVVTVYKMDKNSGSLGSAWGYTSNGYLDRKTTKIDSWGWGVNRNETIGGNECLVVCNSGESEDVYFQVSGEVELTPMVAITPQTWGIIGNNTPVDRVLGDFMVCNNDGLEYNDNKEVPNTGRCRGVLTVYKMDAVSGSLGSAWGYTSNGYLDRKTTKIESWGWGANRNEPVKAGEALVICNSSETDTIQLKLKGPLAE